MTILEKKFFDYTSNFELLVTELNGKNKPNRLQVRDDSFSFFKSNGFPDKKQESWRFTDLSPIINTDFRHVLYNELNQVDKLEFNNLLFTDWEGAQLVFVDGWYKQNLSFLPAGFNEKLFVQSVFHSEDSKYDKTTKIISESLARTDNAFSALNTACFLDGIWISIPDNTILEHPIHILHVATGYDKPHVMHPRHIISLGANSSATIIESWFSLSDSAYFSNPVSDIMLNENAELNHYRYQRESVDAFHISHIYVEQKAHSRYKYTGVERGGRIVRSSVHSVLNGQGANAILNGLYLAGGKQHINNHTLVDHVKHNCKSNELYRGILNDKASAVFDGKVFVHTDAQKSDARQSNSCLLLTDEVKIDAKPQLEIYADDVQCSHGSTVGQLDEESLFYLQSRGIGREKAKSILIYAFAEEIINSIGDETLRLRIEKELQTFLKS